MRKPRKPVLEHENQYVAMDQYLNVFAGYMDGYPFWSAKFDDYKFINNTTHPRTLKSWFPDKQIELIKP